METKTIIFDGGPLDGQMRVIYKNETFYSCLGYNPDDLSKPFEHIYKEDEKVEGHFIYQGKK